MCFTSNFRAIIQNRKRRAVVLNIPNIKAETKSQERQQDIFLSRLCLCVKGKATEVARLIVVCYLCHLPFLQAHRCDNRAIRCFVGVPFCNCTGVKAMTPAGVCSSRRSVPSAITVWVILKRRYVFNLTQLFIKKYIGT